MRLIITIMVLLGALNLSAQEAPKPKACKLTPEVERTYVAYNPLFAKLFEFMRTHDLASMEVGKYPIAGDSLFCSISMTDLRPREQATFEAHMKYIDVQMPLQGQESFGYSDVAQCSSLKRESGDTRIYNDAPQSFLTAKGGEFVIFTTAHAHMPCIGQGTIKKCVFKVLEL